ncbi:MAG TPA: GNAT family N-acetyltransferase [Clostridiales bacterium]|nr:GNAT family N-acetyltransferase [Clostridiales bacterium]
MIKVDIRIIKYQSEDYRQSLLLRDKILRRPLGLNLFQENLNKEINDIHIGVFYNMLIIGVLVLTPLSLHTVKMRQVAVEEEHQGKGFGTRMVAFAETVAKELGYGRIVLHARKTALSFYKRMDYKIIGEEFMEVTVPHFEMEKVIK